MLCLHANCQSSQVDRNQQKGKKILKAMNNKRTFKYSHYTVSNQSNHFPDFWWWKLSSIFVTYIVGFLRFCFNILVVDAESSNTTGTDIKRVVEVWWDTVDNAVVADVDIVVDVVDFIDVDVVLAAHRREWGSSGGEAGEQLQHHPHLAEVVRDGWRDQNGWIFWKVSKEGAIFNPRKFMLQILDLLTGLFEYEIAKNTTRILKMCGGGQRPFGTFPKNHLFW